MIYENFKEYAVNKNKRNMFSTYHGNLALIPVDLQKFYCTNNPIDVEVVYNNAVVHFYSVEALSEIQAEYDYIDADFVFATSNGEPFYLLNGKVYTCIIGAKIVRPELIADSFDKFLKIIIKE